MNKWITEEDVEMMKNRVNKKLKTSKMTMKMAGRKRKGKGNKK